MNRDLSELRSERPFDVLVVGGGINGAGIARSARLAGLDVALVERDDWASGTSSRSSRLVHGGLRYLEQGRFRMVREALRERATLLRIAPHLVEPLRLVAPAWGDSTWGLRTLGLGLGIYGLLAGARRLGHREEVGPELLLEREPGLKRNGLLGAMVFEDARCDDARLVLANVRSAWQAGAVACNYLEAEQIQVEDGRACGARLLDRLTGERFAVRARAVVNATGPWADRVAGLAGERTRRLRLTRGAHLIVPRLTRDALLLQTSDGRVLFVLPDGDRSILGTTDVDQEGSPDDVAATGAEARFLLEETGRSLLHAAPGPEHVLASYAGLRPLVAAGGRPGNVSREHRIEEGETGLFHVVGGKLTTYRAMAEEVVARLLGRLERRPGPAVSDVLPLDGADVPDFAAHVGEASRELSGRHGIDSRQAERLARRYGTRVKELLRLLEEEPRLVEPLCSNHPHLAVEAAHAARHEMAMRLEDLLFRRTRIVLANCRGRDCAARAAGVMAAVAGWSRGRMADEVESFSEARERLTSIRPGT